MDWFHKREPARMVCIKCGTLSRPHDNWLLFPEFEFAAICAACVFAALMGHGTLNQYLEKHPEARRQLP